MGGWLQYILSNLRLFYFAGKPQTLINIYLCNTRDYNLHFIQFYFISGRSHDAPRFVASVSYSGCNSVYRTYWISIIRECRRVPIAFSATGNENFVSSLTVLLTKVMSLLLLCHLHRKLIIYNCK